MTTFCHKCGAPAVDDKSLFCNKCGTRLIPYTPKNNDVCPNCLAKIPDKEPFFCLQCGSPLSQNSDKVYTASFGTGGNTYSQETKQIKEVALFSASDTVTRSQKLKSQRTLKHKSIVFPAILFLIAILLISLLISQSGVLDSLSSLGYITEPAKVTQPVVPTIVKDSYATKNGMKNIVENIEADGRFTTLVTVMKDTELDTMLTSDGPFTLFAPTDDAFKNLPEGIVSSLIKDFKEDLFQILLYHVVNGKLTSADLVTLTSVETLQGGSLPITHSDSTITVDGATVIITDIECSNGVIHVIDTVITPPV